jgi:hypothetical protein
VRAAKQVACVFVPYGVGPILGFGGKVSASSHRGDARSKATTPGTPAESNNERELPEPTQPGSWQQMESARTYRLGQDGTRHETMGQGPAGETGEGQTPRRVSSRDLSGDNRGDIIGNRIDVCL